LITLKVKLAYLPYRSFLFKSYYDYIRGFSFKDLICLKLWLFKASIYLKLQSGRISTPLPKVVFDLLEDLKAA
jgi:hypothetical protein